MRFSLQIDELLHQLDITFFFSPLSSEDVNALVHMIQLRYDNSMLSVE